MYPKSHIVRFYFRFNFIKQFCFGCFQDIFKKIVIVEIPVELFFYIIIQLKRSSLILKKQMVPAHKIALGEHQSSFIISM